MGRLEESPDAAGEVALEAADRFAGCRAGNLEIADPEHVERYWRHTQLLLDTAATGEAAVRICRQINDARTSEAPVA